MSRRFLLSGTLLAGLLPSSGRSAERFDLPARLRELELRHGGRLGVALLDPSTGRAVHYRGNERFALCSTWKCLAAGFVLARAERGETNLAHRVTFDRSALVPYSPITAKHVNETGMTLGEICAAAVTVSDNTAANLMLDSFGGPAALTAYLRSLGDEITRLDRREPDLNDVAPGDLRDTTTPLAIAGTLRKLVLGDALSAPSRAELTAWLEACTTGASAFAPACRQGGASAIRPAPAREAKPTTSPWCGRQTENPW